MTEDDLDADELFTKGRRNLMDYGNSVGFTIYKDELEFMGLDSGDEVIVMVKKDGTAIIKPSERND